MEIKFPDQLTRVPPREKSGSRSANRYDFQKDWAICKILDLHLAGEDYLIICDYHEDIIVLDSENNPTLATFFQIKTKAGGYWTLGELLSRRKGKKVQRLPSILGKLYLNYLLAPDNTESLFFISNASYNFRLNDGKDSKGLIKIECRQLHPAEIEKVRGKLSEESGNFCLLPFDPSLLFEVSPLSLQDHATHTKGKVAEFLEAIFPNRTHTVSPVYNIIFSEVRRKTICEEDISNFQELNSKKSIGRSVIDKIIDEIRTNLDLNELWEEVRERLVHEGLSAVDVYRIRSAWRSFEVERMDATNDILQGLRSGITLLCQNKLSHNIDIPLTTIMDFSWEFAITHGYNKHYTRHFVDAIALMVFYEVLQLS